MKQEASWRSMGCGACQKKILEDRSVLPKEERDLVKEQKPCIMRHSQHFAESGHGGRKSSQKKGGGGSWFWVSHKYDRLVCGALCLFFGVFGSVYWSASLCGSLDFVVQRFSFSLSLTIDEESQSFQVIKCQEKATPTLPRAAEGSTGAESKG